MEVYMAYFGDFEYRVTENNEIEIIKYLGNDKNVTIPDFINNIPVVSIADIPNYFDLVKARKGFSGMESGVFESKGLAYIKLSENLKHIGVGAFLNNRFENRNLILPGSISYIGDCSFSANGFESIEFPYSLTYIGEAAFKDNHLSVIHIPNNIKVIGYWAFGDNPIRQVSIPENVEFGRDDAFGNNLSKYYISNDRRGGKYIRLDANNFNRNDGGKWKWEKI
jgi:hypothetical protein